MISYAQAINLNKWVGRWFKINVSSFSSYCISHEGLYQDPVKMTRYLKLWGWDAGYNVLKGDLYHCHEDKDELQRNDFNLHYFAGTDLNFIFWVEGKETGSNLTLRGADYREGEKMGFNSAKINVPSSYHVNFSFDPKFPWYCAGGNKATGSLITAVPVPPEIIIPP